MAWQSSVFLGSLGNLHANLLHRNKMRVTLHYSMPIECGGNNEKKQKKKYCDNFSFMREAFLKEV